MCFSNERTLLLIESTYYYYNYIHQVRWILVVLQSQSLLCLESTIEVSYKLSCILFHNNRTNAVQCNHQSRMSINISTEEPGNQMQSALKISSIVVSINWYRTTTPTTCRLASLSPKFARTCKPSLKSVWSIWCNRYVIRLKINLNLADRSIDRYTIYRYSCSIHNNNNMLTCRAHWITKWSVSYLWIAFYPIICNLTASHASQAEIYCGSWSSPASFGYKNQSLWLIRCRAIWSRNFVTRFRGARWRQSRQCSRPWLASALRMLGKVLKASWRTWLRLWSQRALRYNQCAVDVSL